MREMWLALMLSACSSGAGELFQLQQLAAYSGMCDASGGVVVSSNRFIVANDEDSVLRLYDSDNAGPPLQEFDFSSFLALDDKSPETDLEAGARIGNRLFWIGSHGRNQFGKRRQSRCRFFATDITVTAGLVALAPVGRPYKDLLGDLLREPSLKQFKLEEASKRIPKEPGALDIEGLSATPEGSLLIGFRNPIPGGMALLVPLLNPNGVLDGERAKFGRPIRLDLDGLGVRDIALFGREYIIIAGAYDGRHRFEFFRWRRPGQEPQRLPVEPFKHFNPEAALIYPERGLDRILLLSDDGTRTIDGTDCKLLKDPAQRSFRSAWLTRTSP